jgi:DNA-binding NarL/FixJ family response regulator
MEVLTRLGEQPADVLLVDAALTRPDPVAFTRRVLNRAPHAAIVMLGDQDPRTAAAAVAAGARGVIRGTGQDLVTTVTKTLLLLGLGDQQAEAGRDGDAGAGVPHSITGRAGAAEPPATPQTVEQAATVSATESAAGRAAGPATVAQSNGGATVVPQQRTDLHPARARGNKRLTLTERELQVLHGMADGKSNAEIGRDLYVSEDTVKTHARRLFRKLGARDRAHAVASGFRAGLVS